ncbi:MAG TPA: dienelactone hydrolase family protein [Chloroflexota bacterium]|nr:dienelactone hydrolase family protein [Chloroflexota bacterium]
MFDAMAAELVNVKGYNGDSIEAFYAHPTAAAGIPGVIVIHHAPGWDDWTKEVVFKLAYHGYAAIAPHLYHRHGPGSWDDVAAAARARGGNPDDQVMGDLEGAAAFLREQPNANGKVGVIGFCSGGRESYMAACKIPSLDAAVDCWGGRVIPKPDDITPNSPVPVIDMTKGMSCPLLGIFGNDDANPDREQVNKIEEELKRHGKDYEFHRYDGAGHGFFATDRPGYRPEQAVDAWNKVFAFYAKHLGVARPAQAAAAGAR